MSLFISPDRNYSLSTRYLYYPIYILQSNELYYPPYPLHTNNVVDFDNQEEDRIGIVNNQKEQCKSPKKFKVNGFNAKILIKFWNVNGISQFIDTNCHTIYYSTRDIKSIDGKIKVSIDFSSVLKTFPGIKDMKVITIMDKTKDKIDCQERDLIKEKNESNELYFYLKTNSKTRNTIVLSFLDERKVEIFKTSFELRDSKTRYRINLKKRGRASSKSSSSKARKNYLKIRIIREIFEKFPKESVKKLISYGIELMKIEKQKKIDENLENKIYETYKDTNFDKNKNDDKGEKHFISCFNYLYKYIYRMGDSIDPNKVNHFDKPIFKKFLKEYPVDSLNINRIIFTMDDIKKKNKPIVK